MGRGSRRGDDLRIYEILQLLLRPFGVEDGEMDTVQKLEIAFGYPAVQIYRRRVYAKFKITGLWWVEDEFKWAWQGHGGAVTKSGECLDRILTTHSVSANTYCYIREGGDHIDLEVRSGIAKWDAVKKRRHSSRRVWLTCSVTPDEYKKLDTYLGPKEDGCLHEDEYGLEIGPGD